MPAELNQLAVDAATKPQAYYLALFERILAAEYLAPLKDSGPGYELLQAFAAVASRCSRSVAHLEVAGLMGTSAGPQKARATVAFSRAPGGAPVTVDRSTVVRASLGARDFVLLDGVFFDQDVEGPLTVEVEAVEAGYDWNVPGPRTTAAGEVLPGSIGTIKYLVTVPAYGDTTLTVAQTTDATGGQPAVLDAWGADRMLPRIAGESDARYLQRLVTLQDTVTPNAISAAISNGLSTAGVSATLVDVDSPDYQTGYDMEPGDHNDSLFTYDDPRDAFPFRGRWLDGSRVGLLVEIPDFPTSGPTLKSLWEQVQRIKAAGVPIYFERADTGISPPVSQLRLFQVNGESRAGYTVWAMPRLVTLVGENFTAGMTVDLINQGIAPDILGVAVDVVDGEHATFTISRAQASTLGGPHTYGWLLNRPWGVDASYQVRLNKGAETVTTPFFLRYYGAEYSDGTMLVNGQWVPAYNVIPRQRAGDDATFNGFFTWSGIAVPDPDADFIKLNATPSGDTSLLWPYEQQISGFPLAQRYTLLAHGANTTNPVGTVYTRMSSYDPYPPVNCVYKLEFLFQPGGLGTPSTWATYNQDPDLYVWITAFPF